MTSATEGPRQPDPSLDPASSGAGPGRPGRPGRPGGAVAAAWSGLGALAALAADFGVATSYDGQDGRPVTVAPEAVRGVLELLGVDTADPAAALARERAARRRRPLPPCVVMRASSAASVEVHLPAETADEPSAVVVLADGGHVPVTFRPAAADGGVGVGVDGDGGGGGGGGTGEEVDGRLCRGAAVDLPAGLPLGDHLLRVRAGASTEQCPLIVVPDRVPDVLTEADGLPPAEPEGPAVGGPAVRGAGVRRAGEASGRAWGWMIQLYALASAGSWAIGDYADLATIAGWSGRDGADVLLVNPLHAAAPTFPVEPSPYSPASRRFVSPLYLRPELLPEYLQATDEVRAEVDRLARRAREEGIADGLLDRDAVWRSKLAALELLFATASAGAGRPSDGALGDFALWCALAERHGRDWRTWPEDLRDPAGPAVEAARGQLADRVAFHTWLQRRCDDQLAAAQSAATAAGMRVGIVHDLAVGVDPGGADAWAMRGVLAAGASVGAPPDGFNQQGQDWGLPPWRPVALAESGYAPFREMVRAVLSRGGGLRVDHILGLFRLWWVPARAGASGGTYVRYDASALLGLLALEASRAGALVVGEDLGTVEASVAQVLDQAGIFGSSVLWFERRADGSPRSPGEYRERSMASVTTHDLPTAAGFLDGEHVRVRGRLGLLARSGEEERAAWLAERADLLRLLAAEGLAAEGLADEGLAPEGEERAEARERAVLGMHALLGRSRARVVLIAPGDAFGDPRQPNLPGTVDSYPNWRLPVVDSAGRRVTVERLLTDPRPRNLVAALGARAVNRPDATTARRP
ncbi:4-alpha-glucanotransferase [Frankia sp. EI5c]|uniref:4-alpha-glucanotransferase n=1 Tax=Frankia sp. EI5c TaxID=683316 RepID=UPI0007C311F8|nr:4-alpha-glucanotransferase [Frankia sp. EI5c]OAA21599.1 4-alpha-glucanotransferase [Frankia sp. EI5c]